MALSASKGCVAFSEIAIDIAVKDQKECSGQTLRRAFHAVLTS